MLLKAELPDMLNLSHAAEFLGISRPTLYALLFQGELKTVDIDNFRFILKTDLENYKTRREEKHL